LQTQHCTTTDPEPRYRGSGRAYSVPEKTSAINQAP